MSVWPPVVLAPMAGVTNAPFVQTTICPLGPSAVSCVASINKFFRDEVLERLRNDAGVHA